MTVTWLHISDLHIRAGEPYDRDIVLRALIDSVKQFRQAGRAPDLIFATGDVVVSGEAAEYEIATEFFDALLGAAALDRRRLFVIPGNHDVNRRMGLGLARTLSSHEEADSYFSPTVPKPHLKQKLKAFTDWHDSYFAGIRQLPGDSTCGPVEVAEIRGCRIGVLPINSALFSQSDDDHSKLIIGRRPLEAATALLDEMDADLRVALVHHPLDWLSDIERPSIIAIIRENVDVMLRGHLHENDGESVVSAQSGFLYIAAGASYQTRRWLNRAYYATFEGEHLTLFPIRYEDQPRELWTTDPSVFPYDAGHAKRFLIRRLAALTNKPIETSPANLSETSSLPHSGSGDAVYAGFYTDALPTGTERGVTRRHDRLGVMRDVTALCEVLAARETRPPLAVGLFSDWGTGKSFFMELMRKEIARFGERNPSFYCTHVVQVWFNAWHYMDTNLWASLAARVFEELAEQPKRWEPREDVRQRLFRELQESRGVLAEAMEEKKEANARLHAIGTQQQQKRESLSAAVQTAVTVAMANLASDPEVQTKLKDATKQLGLPTLEVEVGKVEEQAREVKRLGRRTWIVFRALLQEPVWLPMAILVFAVVTFGVSWILEIATQWTEAARLVTGITVGIAAFRTTITPILRETSRAMGWLEDVSIQIQQKRAAAEREAKAVVQSDLMRLDEREREVQARIDALEHEIQELSAGRRLQRFILERHTSAEYRQHLGIVNLIRNDFEKLSALLTESAQKQARNAALRRKTGGGEVAVRSNNEEGVSESPQIEGQDNGMETESLPLVDRIVLYIDDLDRCPEDRVVEVLQAVHLLLAFPLFVVVVGVDSRWLLLSLEDHYAALRNNGGEQRKNQNTEAEWSTTPQNYLEKIFQIPFTLRPMEPAGFGRLVEALLPVKGKTQAAHAGEGLSNQTQRVTSTIEAPTEHVPLGEVQEEDISAADEQEHDATPKVSGLTPLPPNPQGLTVEVREREFIRFLHPLIASPRALKRFTNVYRFLRVQQRGANLDLFRGTDQRPGEFQVVALLLAALVGYPTEATKLLSRVLTAHDESWWALVEALDSPDLEEKEAREEGTNRLAYEAVPEGRRARPNLRDALLEVRRTVSIADYPLETFVRWTREVARFSFQSGRILSVRNYREERTDSPPTASSQGS
ncbi:MAG TPA: P-loop NTPase fold protein [Longimicrobiaceae bacterium]|nr:P-loop NTPase fold protein [Longimicrobiaceae bacterium]